MCRLLVVVAWLVASAGPDFVGLVAPIDYGDEQHGFTVGVQLETWW